MKTKKVLGLMLALVVTASGLAGCANKDNAKSTKIDADQELTTVLFEQSTLDIHEATDQDSIEIISETMEGLARVENDGTGDTIKPGIAKDWKISDDGLVYTFNLRDAKWTDGKPVTAQQFVDSWIRLLDPEKGFGYSYFAFDVKNAKKYYSGEAKVEDIGIKAVDEKTFEVTLERPTPYFIKKIGFQCFFPIRLEEVTAQGETYGTEYSKMSFNGPFVITEYVASNKVVLGKNSTYWDADKVKLQKITMQNIQETSTQMQMFESKQLDITGATGEYLVNFKNKANSGDFNYMTAAAPSSTYLSCNLKTGGPSGLVKSEKIRQAIAYVMDRKDIVEKVYGRFIAAYSFVPYKISIGDKEYRKEVPEQMTENMKKYDTIDKVNALFKEGLADLGKDPNGKYEFLFLTYGSDATSKSRQEYYQNALNKLTNLDVKINSAVDFNQYLDVYHEQVDYDVALAGWNGDYDDPMTFMDMWITGGGNNTAAYSNVQYDKLMDQDIMNETDTAKRKDIYAAAETLLMKELPIIPLYYSDTNRFVHKYVKDVQFPLFGTTYEMKYTYIQGK